MSLQSAKSLHSLKELRAYIHRTERSAGDSGAAVLPLGLEPVDRALPDGGLPLGALHDIRGDGGPLLGFTAFLMGRVAQRGRPVLWLDPADDLYLPGLQPYGLDTDNLVIARAIAGDKAMLWALNEAVATPALGAVAAPLSRPDFTSLRRLSLTAREQGVTLFLIRRSGELGASPALTRWQVSAAPSRPTGLPGMGETAWRLTLEKCRGGPEALCFSISRDRDGWRADIPHPALDTPALLTG